MTSAPKRVRERSSESARHSPATASSSAGPRASCSDPGSAQCAL
eukprot:CAMPEP_0174935668 /NCGR_PEP_ID=MMETSP1355-20121228/54532_1 /TAXON_ID=464990 /ORGANISM="Hemiselmis tepida, Strain CCMP443" /LENGTH=43 /DNA_ID= /DNA_START= /DNA_END= /DNA_ORIENTATION=